MAITKKQILDFAESRGADLVGIADTSRLAGIETHPFDLLETYSRAVSMAIRLSDEVMDRVRNGPTEQYSQHYRTINAQLNELAPQMSRFLQSGDAAAMALPASQILDEEHFYASLSHKAVAIAAGLGWQGKSLLLVTPQFGPRVRLVTVLTDLDIPADEPVANRCGTCPVCSKACPAGAIRGEGTDWHYQSRSEALDLERCVTKLREFHAENESTVQYLCGVCVSSCPRGKS